MSNVLYVADRQRLASDSFVLQVAIQLDAISVANKIATEWL
jgi:hypothetical protein